MIFAFDFDGTLCEHKYPEIGPKIDIMCDIARDLHSAGHKIIIWTCRYIYSDISSMLSFLIENDVPYDKLNDNIEDIGFSPFPKIYADYYIDDRSPFFNIYDIVFFLSEFLPEERRSFYKKWIDSDYKKSCKCGGNCGK
jgi:hypothetical protein